MKNAIKWVGMFVSVTFAGVVTGCVTPCNDLQDKICSDLGADCGTFSSEPSIRYSVLPRSTVLRKPELAQCEMYLSAENYNAYTIVHIRNQIAKLRDPNAPQQPLPQIHMVDGLFSGFSSNLLYGLPIVVILGMFLYMRWYKKKMMELQKK